MTDDTEKLSQILQRIRNANDGDEPSTVLQPLMKQYLTAATAPGSTPHLSADDQAEVDGAVDAFLRRAEEADWEKALSGLPMKYREVLTREPPEPDQAPVITEWDGHEEPEPVIWRDPGPIPAKDAEPDKGDGAAWCGWAWKHRKQLQDDDPKPAKPFVDSAVSVGEIAVLSAPGGTGKSYLTLALARAAHPKNKGGAACGLRVRPGPVLLVSYEDSPVRIIHRLKKIAWGESLYGDHLHTYKSPGPLFEADADAPGHARPTQVWDRMWEIARDIRPSLVIIDPASSALADVSVSEGGPVRRFMTEAGIEAERAGCGVLIVAHDTKAARNEARASGEPGAGAIAGSAQWYDAARGALYLYKSQAEPGRRILTCIKANHGSDGWGATLEGTKGQWGDYRGLRLRERLPDAIKAMREDAKRGPGTGTTSTTAAPSSERKRPPKLEDI